VTTTVLTPRVVVVTRPSDYESLLARRVAELRSFGDFLVREEILERNPFRMISAPRTPKRLPRYLTVAEVEMLLAVPDTSTPLGLRDRAIIEVLHAAGYPVRLKA